jgi:hypothetical protein
VTPSGGFTGSVALTAALTASPTGATDLPTLSFGSTSPVGITGASAGTATLTVSTTAATSASLARPKFRAAPQYATEGYAAGGVALACLLLFGIPARRRRWRALLGAIILFALLTGGIVSCGGGGGGGGGGKTGGSPGTTAGAYTITVTGVSGQVTETTTVSLTVN